MATLTPELTTGGVEVEETTGWTLREAVVSHIKSLALPGIPAENVRHRTFANLEGVPTPCVVVAKGRGVFSVQPGTNGRTDNRYAIYIVAVRASQRQLDGSTDHARQLDAWLEAVALEFNDTRPPLDVPFCILNSRVADNDPQRAPEWIKQLDAVYLLVHITVRETRPDA